MFFLPHPILLSLVALSTGVPALGISTSLLPSLPERVCAEIEGRISPASGVYYPGDPIYERGISHFSPSSTQRSKCVVEPGNENDVAQILKIVGSHRTPFAVKGGGHATNPGFSSTTGVHISMTQFSNIQYHPLTQTVVVGMGLVWDDVYAALEPYNRTVVGGRVSGIGVGGLSLGGGYSWKTNQYGLTIDTIEAFRLVNPDGSITTVTHASQPDLFFALKGTQNNFGIVTEITLKTFPQMAVWGGTALFPGESIYQVADATTAFYQTVTDPKAAILVLFGMIMANPIASVLLFYDGPNPPPGIFDSFLSLPAVTSDLRTRSYLSMIQASPPSPVENPRGLFEAVPRRDITSQFLNATLSELLSAGQSLTTRENTYILFMVEPFLPNILQHTHLPSAYPPNRNQAYLPCNIAAAWPDAASDSVYYQAVKGMGSRLRALTQSLTNNPANSNNQPPRYPNYALYDTPLQDIFGANLPKLKKLKSKVDPKNVMGLAGGFKL
ncbi:FAD-binding domain-containing protein [Panaeolus papilionaceus]|nr:FAD-binding domain-containing protein [Panaeolus papilionaceus]